MFLASGLPAQKVKHLLREQRVKWQGMSLPSVPTADRERVVQLEHATAEKNVLLVHSTFISLHFTEEHISEIVEVLVLSPLSVLLAAQVW